MHTKTILNITRNKLFNNSKLQKDSFCEIFGNYISRKSGQKCCVYGQNGKPLKKETVIKFLENMQATNNYEIHKAKNLSDFRKSLKLINWSANEDYTILTRIFYFKNVFYLTDFIKEIYNTDYSSNLQQIPNIHVMKKELLKIDLTTPDLKGLSMKDLQLAFALNTLNFDKYLLYPIKEESNFKKEIRNITLFEQQEKDNKENIQERTKLKNKYDALQYENYQNAKKFDNEKFENLFSENYKVENSKNENQNKFANEEKEEALKIKDIEQLGKQLQFEDDSGCCSPEGTCACKQASKYKL